MAIMTSLWLLLWWVSCIHPLTISRSPAPTFNFNTSCQFSQNCFFFPGHSCYPPFFYTMLIVSCSAPVLLFGQYYSHITYGYVSSTRVPSEEDVLTSGYALLGFGDILRITTLPRKSSCISLSRPLNSWVHSGC